MNTLPISATLGTLGLPSGDQWVKFHVEGEIVSFEIAATVPQGVAQQTPRKPTGFVQQWGGSAKKVDDASDAWLTHINEKHLR